MADPSFLAWPFFEPKHRELRAFPKLLAATSTTNAAAW
jgi:hypothetical protein